MNNNPLLNKWPESEINNSGGIPPFDQVKFEHFKPALISSINEGRVNYAKITEQTAEPTFENTILPLESATDLLRQVESIYDVHGTSLVTPELQELKSEMSLLLSAFKDEMIQNEKLFKRIKKVFLNKENSNLNNEQKRLVQVIYNNFIRYGAELSADKKNELTKINQRLATLTTDFEKNLLADEDDQFLLIENKSDIQSLPSWLIEAAANEATKRNHNGFYALANTRSIMEPFLTYCSDRHLREKAFKLWSSRGENKNEKVISEILSLRLASANILGFKNYSDWRLSNTMAKDPKKAEELLLKIWEPAVKKFKNMTSELQKIVDAEKSDFKIQPWDFRYYQEKNLKTQLEFDAEILKPYLKLENLLKALFWTAEKLYGFKFKKIENIPVFHKDVTVYEVLQTTEFNKNQIIGLWYFDPFARNGKSSGAWMASYREQQVHSFDNSKAHIYPIVSNNSNFIKPADNQTPLLSWDEAITLFHEFGHGLHGLSSKVNYPTLSGTNTTLDFVELPSQLHEHFLSTPEVLNFLENDKGQKIPKELLSKLKKAENFSVAFHKTEFLASALFDIKVHQLIETPTDIKKYEEQLIKEIGMPAEIIMRHRPTQFAHLFTGEGYSSGYYAYLWADVLTKDAFQAFSETKNPFHPEIAQKYFNEILSVGNSIDPEQAFKNFRGRDPDVKPLIQALGFD